MELAPGLQTVSKLPRVVTIGMFDGVHPGHQATIRRCIELARARAIRSTVLTFARHPLAVLAPSHAPQLLTSREERIRLIEALGPDELVMLPFNAALAAMTPQEFCAHVLADRLDARVVVVGENFHFGARGAGSAATLRACGAGHGFETEVVGLQIGEAGPISSTRIRAMLRAGAVEDVRAVLGRPPSLSARVVSGAGRGRSAVGVPTANLAAPPELMLPGRGVYAARALHAGVWYRAAVNVGRNPTFTGAADSPDAVEAHLLGFSGELLGESLRLEFLQKLRDERRFASVSELSAQIRRDLDVVAACADEAFTEVGLGTPVEAPSGRS